MSRRACAALGVLAALAACGPSHTTPNHASPAARQPAPLPAPSLRKTAAPRLANGRFAIVTAPHESSATFLLDTMTGRVWRLEQKRDLEGAPWVWEHMDRLDSNADDYVFKQEHPPTGTQ